MLLVRPFAMKLEQEEGSKTKPASPRDNGVAHIYKHSRIPKCSRILVINLNLFVREDLDCKSEGTSGYAYIGPPIKKCAGVRVNKSEGLLLAG